MVVYNSFVIHSQETCPGSRNQMSFEIFVYEVVVTKIYSDKKGPEIQGKNEYIFVLFFLILIVFIFLYQKHVTIQLSYHVSRVT